MVIYRFKVSFEEHEDISREIDIRSSQTFEDLHYAIQAAVGFDASQPASFYMSNDHWIKGEEIVLKEREGQSEKCVLMHKAVLSDWISDPHQKIYYLFDYSAQWTFYVELYRIFPTDDTDRKYPICIKVNGEAPKQRAVITPIKENDLGLDEADVLLVQDNYTEDETGDEVERVIINEDEVDNITSEEEITEERGNDEEEK